MSTTVVTPLPNDLRAPQSTASPDRPRSLRTRTLDDHMSLVGSAIGALMLVWVLYEGVLPFSGGLGFLVMWFLVFLVMYAIVSAMSQPRTIVIDRIASAAVHAAAFVVVAAVASTVIYTFWKGHRPLFHSNFFLHDMAGVRPTAPFTEGGILHALLGTLIEIGVGVAAALPLGIVTAIYMTEVGGRVARLTRTVVEAMTALPDVVAGLFIYVVLIIYLGFGRTGFCAAMSLTVMMTPIIARSADVALRVVPGGLREAALALGASQWRAVWRVVLPTARPGLATAVILGIARGIGETAPVLLTSGATTFLNVHPLHNEMNSLPLFIYTAKLSGEDAYITRGFAAASVLLFIVLVLFVLVRLLARTRRSTR